MKIGLIGVNSQFVHSNLAIYYLREELPDSWEGELCEYNQNEPILKIFYDIMDHGFDAVAFSVYLWNKETVIKLTKLIRVANKDIVIILGGPEPTYGPKAFPVYDYIVYGALEPVWGCLLERLAQGQAADDLPGVNGEIAFVSEWKFPYREEDLPRLENKLVYYESSRGCPYHCAFCLSSAEDRTGFLPLERVEKELDFFLAHNIPVVKFVDRTFNAPKERGKAILRYLLAHYKPGVTFHFELKGELLDDETVDLLTSAPAGFFQVEIGVQSLNETTLAESRRRNHWEQTKGYYRRLIGAENVHTHFDLIAGLPYEDLSSFVFGFNEVMTIYPHYLQVGFLKLLPGTKLAAECELHGYAAEDFPPYEIVSNRYLSVAELAGLKKLDQFMDTVYNKGLLRQTLRYAMRLYGFDTFTLFMALAENTDVVRVLSEICPRGAFAWSSLVRLDGFLVGNGGDVSAEEERDINRFVQDKDAVAEVLPHYVDTPPREIYKRTRLLHFPVTFSFDEKGFVLDVSPGESRILLDYREKGRRKRGKGKPMIYSL